MWPFRRREEPDPLLEGVKKGVIATLAAHGAAIEQMNRALNELRADIAHAVAIDKRVQTVEHLAKSLDRHLDGEISRIDASLVQVRGLATGHGRRTPRGQQAEAAQVGEKLIAAIADPEARHALIAELQQLDANGAAEPPNPVGM